MVNGHDTAVKPRTIQVWTREETMEVARAGATIVRRWTRRTAIAYDFALERPRRARTRDRRRARGRTLGRDGGGVVGGDDGGGVRRERLERELDAARARARRGGTKRRKKEKGETSSNPDAGAKSDEDAGAKSDEDAGARATLAFAAKRASLAPLPSTASLVTHRKIKAEDMARQPRGATRVVEAGSTVLLPTNGFMVVAGVLQSTELALRVHAYEQPAGRDIRERAADDEASFGGPASATDVEEEGWRTANSERTRGRTRGSASRR